MKKKEDSRSFEALNIRDKDTVTFLPFFVCYLWSVKKFKRFNKKPYGLSIKQS